MLRILLRCDFEAAHPKLREKLEKNHFMLVENGEDVSLFVPRLTKKGWESEVLARAARGGTVVIVKRESVPLAEERLCGSGATVLPADVPFPVLAGVLLAEARAGERLFAVCGEIDRLRAQLECEKLVHRAKLILMERGMNEEQAHRFLEKQAMDRRLSRRVIAEEILNEKAT